MVYLSQSAQLTGGNVALGLAWDGKYNLELICLVMKIGEISKVRITENISTIWKVMFSGSVKHFIFTCSLFLFLWESGSFKMTFTKICLSNFYVDPCGLLFLTVFCSIPQIMDTLIYEEYDNNLKHKSRF